MQMCEGRPARPSVNTVCPCPDIGNIGAIMTTLCSGMGISVAGLALVCAAAGLLPRPRPVAGRTHQL